MPTYNKTVKRGNGKPITHYVGKNRKGIPEKFRLGYDPAAAQRSLDQIQALWDHLEIWVSEAKANIEIKGKTKLRTYWTQPYLKAAKAIAKGEPPTLPKGEYEQPELYLKRLGLISEASGTKFEPANPDEYETAVYLVKPLMNHAARFQRRQMSWQLPARPSKTPSMVTKIRSEGVTPEQTGQLTLGVKHDSTR